jgi:hypothetical protein
VGEKYAGCCLGCSLIAQFGIAEVLFDAMHQDEFNAENVAQKRETFAENCL